MKYSKYCVCTCVCTDHRPLGSGACLPHGGGGGRGQRPANPPHTRHWVPLLIFQLPLRPQQVAKATKEGVCRSHEHQGCSSTYEGAFVVYIIILYNICTFEVRKCNQIRFSCFQKSICINFSNNFSHSVQFKKIVIDSGKSAHAHTL